MSWRVIGARMSSMGTYRILMPALTVTLSTLAVRSRLPTGASLMKLKRSATESKMLMKKAGSLSF
jgi:hypothetical protein